MTDNVTQEPQTKEEAEKQARDWAQKEYVKISKYCGSKGYQVKNIDRNKCHTLSPILGIWYVKTLDKKTDLWVLSGDFPTDIAHSDVAKNAREAIRYFSMSWQIQAAKLEDGVAVGKIDLQDKETQTKYAKELVTRAESLYDLFSSDKLWKNAGLEK